MTRDRRRVNVDGFSAAFLAFIKALPEWRRDAACISRPDVNWFPAAGESAEPAKAVCAGCPVQAPCLYWAIEHGEVGVWGGLSANERAAIHRQRRSHRVQT